MYRKWFIWGPLVALVVIGTLVMGGLLVYRVGWAQGSLSSPVEEGGMLVPPMPFGFRHPARAFGFSPLWFGLGLVVRFGMLLLVFGVIARLFFSRRWRIAGVPRGRRWAGHWYPPFGPGDPWHWPPEEEELEKTEPTAESEDAEAES